MSGGGMPFDLKTDRDTILSSSWVDEMLADDYFCKPLAHTRASTLKLLENDKEVRALAEAIRADPKPEAVASFVAMVERKSEHLRYDMPGWSGNEHYQNLSKSEWRSTVSMRVHHNDPMFGHAVREREAALNTLQNDCLFEAMHTTQIVQGLQDKGYLGAEWEHKIIKVDSQDELHKGISHVAPVFYKAGQPPQAIEGFVIDSWLVSPGQPAPSFTDMKNWQNAAGQMSEVEMALLTSSRERFYKTPTDLHTLLGEKKDRDGVEYDVKRTFDQGYLLDWYKKNAPDRPRPLQKNSEAEQDLLVMRDFLGKEPKIASEHMDHDHFKSLQARVLHIMENDKDNVGLANVSAEKIRSSASFAQMKAELEKFYEAYGLSNDIFRDRSPSLDWALMVPSFDMDQSNKIDVNERRMLEQLYRSQPEALRAFQQAMEITNDSAPVMDAVSASLKNTEKAKGR